VGEAAGSTPFLDETEVSATAIAASATNPEFRMVLSPTVLNPASAKRRFSSRSRSFICILIPAVSANTSARIFLFLALSPAFAFPPRAARARNFDVFLNGGLPVFRNLAAGIKRRLVEAGHVTASLGGLGKTEIWNALGPA
jgi:hypothetical protein